MCSSKLCCATAAADTFGTATCCRVSIKALSVRTKRVIIAPNRLLSELQPQWRFKCCLVTSSAPRAPLPRLIIWPFVLSRGAYTLHCIPGKQLRPIPSPAVPPYSTATRPHTTTLRVDSCTLPDVVKMNCVSTETPQEDSDQSSCATHCEQRLNIREQKYNKRDPNSFARVAFKLVNRGRVIRISVSGKLMYN